MTRGGRPVDELSQLQIPATANGTAVDAIALSPDGTRLAVALQPDAAGNPHGPQLLRVYSVATGAVLRTWTATGSVPAVPAAIGWPDPNSELQWADGDRELAFISVSTTPGHTRGTLLVHTTLRVLDTARAGTGAIAGSRLVWSSDFTAASGSGLMTCGGLGNLLITADGTTVVCGAVRVTGTAGHAQTWTLTWLEYSAATGKLARALPAGTASGTNMDFMEAPLRVEAEWADPSGGTIIGYWPAGATRNGSASNFPLGQLGVFSGGGYTPLPAAPNGGALIENDIAW